MDEYLRVAQAGEIDGIIPDVYAAGDCATFEVNPLAATAQAAEQEGKYLAKYHLPASDFTSTATLSSSSPCGLEAGISSLQTNITNHLLWPNNNNIGG